MEGHFLHRGPRAWSACGEMPTKFACDVGFARSGARPRRKRERTFTAEAEASEHAGSDRPDLGAPWNNTVQEGPSRGIASSAGAPGPGPVGGRVVTSIRDTPHRAVPTARP